VIDAAPFWSAYLTSTDAHRWRWQPTSESINVDRSRKVTFVLIARKPAPMLVPDRLTVKVTVKICEAEESAMQIKSLEGSLMIEWE